MSRSFHIPLTGDAEALVARAEKAARQHNAEFSGDISAGRFAGRGVEGQYKVQGDTVTVTITKKPLWILGPWVEKSIASLFA